MMNDIIRQRRNWVMEHMGWETQQKRSRGVTLLPLSGRRVPRRNNSTGEGGAGRQSPGR